MALDVFFKQELIDGIASTLVSIIGASPGSVEFCRGAWLVATARVIAIGGDVAELEARCKSALGADVWGLLGAGSVLGGVDWREENRG